MTQDFSTVLQSGWPCASIEASSDVSGIWLGWLMGASQACPTGRRPWGRPSTRYWDALRMPQDPPGWNVRCGWECLEYHGCVDWPWMFFIVCVFLLLFFFSRVVFAEQHYVYSCRSLWCFIGACAHCCGGLHCHEGASQPPWLRRVSEPFNFPLFLITDDLNYSEAAKFSKLQNYIQNVKVASLSAPSLCSYKLNAHLINVTHMYTW